MALNVFELFGKIAIDSNSARKGLDDTTGHAKKTESSLRKIFKTIGGFIAAAFSVRTIIDFGKTCTDVFATIAAEESAFAQIMGDYADTAQAKLNAVADQTGITATRMTGAMTSLTAKFKGLGYSTEDATTLAADGLLIAADAAAFWDMSLDESTGHLNSFINGSYEGGEAIGLFANDTQMAAYAVEKGIVKDAKAWAELDEATKQATRLDYAKNMQAQSGAAGQAAKESEAYANVMANLKESWRQFQGVIGKPILEKIVLPAMQKLNAFIPKMTEAVQNGIVWLEEGFDKIKGYFADVFTEDGINLDALPNALSTMFRDLGQSAGKLLHNFGQTLREGWSNTVWPAIQGVAAKIGIELPSWAEIETKVVDWWDGGNGVSQVIADVCNWTLNLFGAPADVTAEDVSSTLGTWWNNAVTFVQDACAWTLKLFNNPAEASEDIKNVVSVWWNTASVWVADACNWTLNLFGAPADVTAEDVTSTLGEWWGKAVAFVQDACAWTLKLFNNPTEAGEDVKNLISTWWSSVVGTVQDACAWALNVFQNPPDITAEEVVEILDSWWSKASAFVQDACSWALNLFGAPEDVTAEDVAAVIGGWWDKAVQFVQSACSWALQLFTNPTEDQQVIIDAVEGWWEVVRAVVEGVCTWTLSLFGLPSPEEAINEIKKWWNDVLRGAGIPVSEGSTVHQTPAGYDGGGGGFRWDDGPPDLNRTPGWSTYEDAPGNSGSNSIPALVGAVQALTASVQGMAGEIPSAIAAGISGISVTGTVTTGNVTLNTGALVGQLAPKLDLRLGRSADRAGRG